MSSNIREQIAEGNDSSVSNPLSVRDVDGETSKPKLQATVTVSNVNEPRKEAVIQRKSAPTKETVHLDIGLPFIRNKLIDRTAYKTSTYVPSSYMLYYILHCMDNLMCQNHHFLQNNNHYHPLVMRIYYGILFYIQVLRCMSKAKILDRRSNEFLTHFLNTYPPESLSIAGPLATLFQSITVSESRFTNLGRIGPTIPDTEKLIEIKPKEDESILVQSHNWLLPNMYLLFGSLNSLTSQRLQGLIGTPNFPKSWNPFSAISNSANDNAVSGVPFNGLDLATDINTWTATAKWMMTSSSTCFRLESTKELDEKFSRQGEKLNIPPIEAEEKAYNIEEFLNLTDLEWFGNVLAMATSHAKYFKQPTTLDKCSTVGPMTSQIVCKYQNPPRRLLEPRYPGDNRAMFPLSFIGISANPQITDTDQIMAFSSQLNVAFPPNHPYAALVTYSIEGNQGFAIREGPYWSVRPIMMESGRDNGYMQLSDVIQDHFYLDKPKY